MTGKTPVLETHNIMEITILRPDINPSAKAKLFFKCRVD